MELQLNAERYGRRVVSRVEIGAPRGSAVLKAAAETEAQRTVNKHTLSTQSASQQASQPSMLSKLRTAVRKRTDTALAQIPN